MSFKPSSKPNKYEGSTTISNTFGNMIRLVTLIILVFVVTVNSDFVYEWTEESDNEGPSDDYELETETESLPYRPEDVDIIEGDVVVNKGPTTVSAVRDKDKLWPNGVVPLKEGSNLPKSHRQALKRAAAYLSEKTCVKFVQYNGQANYVEVQ